MRCGTEPYVALLESMYVSLFHSFLPFFLLSPSVLDLLIILKACVGYLHGEKYHMFGSYSSKLLDLDIESKSLPLGCVLDEPGTRAWSQCSLSSPFLRRYFLINHSSQAIMCFCATYPLPNSSLRFSTELPQYVLL